MKNFIWAKGWKQYPATLIKPNGRAEINTELGKYQLHQIHFYLFQRRYLVFSAQRYMALYQRILRRIKGSAHFFQWYSIVCFNKQG